MNSITFLHNYAIDGIKIIQFNVGQGDHSLIQFPDKEYAIIDFFCDYRDNSTEEIEPPAVKYFRKLKKLIPNEQIKIKFVCLSHLDSDHIMELENSLMTLVDELKISIEQIWLPNALDFDDALQRVFNEYEDFREIIKTFIVEKDQQRLINNTHQRIAFLHGPKFKKKLKHIDCRTSPFIQIPVRIDFYGPSENVSLKTSLRDSKNWAKLVVAIARSEGSPIFFPGFTVDRNELSIVLKIVLNNKQCALFTGDAAKGALQTIIKAGADLRSRFIKVPHHGSKHSSSDEIWETFLPSEGTVFSGISAGDGYDHPHEETIKHMVGATSKDVTHYILNTNLSSHDLEKLPIERIETDLFTLKEEEDRYKHLRNLPYIRMPEARVEDTRMGLLGFLQVIQPNSFPQPQALLSVKTKIYNNRTIRHCPICFKPGQDH